MVIIAARVLISLLIFCFYLALELQVPMLTTSVKNSLQRDHIGIM